MPVGTYTGWNLRAGMQEGCDANDMFLPFARTKQDRLANNDPRPSLAERYPSHETYVNAVTASADALRAQGLLLDEDAAQYAVAASQSAVGR